MATTTVIARHRSDVTASSALRAAARRLRTTSAATVPAPQHRGGMPPAVGTSMLGVAAVAASAITALGMVR